MEKVFIFKSNQPLINDNIRFWLLVSVGIVIGIAVISMIIIQIIVSNLKNKNKATLKTMPIRPNQGEIKADVKNALNIKLKDSDVEYLINNVFVNQYENILVVGKDLEYISYIINNQLLWANTFNTNLNDTNIQTLKSLDCLYDFKEDKIDFYEAILLINDDNSLNKIHDYYQKLVKNGMIIANISFLNSYSRKLLIQEFKTKNYTYEISPNKNFILIVKKIY